MLSGVLDPQCGARGQAQVLSSDTRLCPLRLMDPGASLGLGCGNPLDQGFLGLFSPWSSRLTQNLDPLMGRKGWG